MIYCPECNGKTRVIYNRKENRRRQCTKCLYKFNTIESLVEQKDTIEVSRREYEAFTKVMQAAKNSIHLVTHQKR